MTIHIYEQDLGILPTQLAHGKSMNKLTPGEPTPSNLARLLRKPRRSTQLLPSTSEATWPAASAQKPRSLSITTWTNQNSKIVLAPLTLQQVTDSSAYRLAPPTRCFLNLSFSPSFSRTNGPFLRVSRQIRLCWHFPLPRTLKEGTEGERDRKPNNRKASVHWAMWAPPSLEGWKTGLRKAGRANRVIPKT